MSEFLSEPAAPSTAVDCRKKPKGFRKQGKYAGYGNIAASWALAKMLDDMSEKFARKVMRHLISSHKIFSDLRAATMPEYLRKDVATLLKLRCFVSINELKKAHPEEAEKVSSYMKNVVSAFSLNVMKGRPITGLAPSKARN